MGLGSIFFRSASNQQGIIADIIQTSGVLTQDIKEEKKSWQEQQKKHVDDNADFKTDDYSIEINEILIHASLVSGWETSKLIHLFDNFIVDEDTFRQAMNIKSENSGKVQGEAFAEAMKEHALAYHDDPYENLSAVDKLKVLWHFINRNIEDDSVATRVAAKFKFTDDDAAELASEDETVKHEAAVNAFKMRLENQVSVRHMFTSKIDKSLSHAIDAATNEVEFLEDTDLDVLDYINNSMLNLDLEDKVRLLAGAVANIDSSEPLVKRASFKIIADFFVDNEDIEYLEENADKLSSPHGEAFELSSLDSNIWDQGFENGKTLDFPGALTELVWQALTIDEYTMATIPVTERRRIADELCYLLAVIKAESNILQRPSASVLHMIQGADERREANSRESVIQQILRYEQEYKNSGSVILSEAIGEDRMSEHGFEIDSEDNTIIKSGAQEQEEDQELQLFAELFQNSDEEGNPEANEDASDDNEEEMSEEDLELLNYWLDDEEEK